MNARGLVFKGNDGQWHYNVRRGTLSIVGKRETWWLAYTTALRMTDAMTMRPAQTPEGRSS